MRGGEAVGKSVAEDPAACGVLRPWVMRTVGHWAETPEPEVRGGCNGQQ